MKRILFILVAFSMLNQSIDLDFVIGPTLQLKQIANFDDIDTITELLLESLLGNNNLISENDNDEGQSKNKAEVKLSWNPSFCQEEQDIQLYIAGSTKGLKICDFTVYKTSKGFFNIISPPPDLAS